MKRNTIAALVVAALGLLVLGVVLFVTGGGGVTRSLVYENDGAIWRANVDGSQPRRIGKGSEPVISPDGRLIVLVREPEPPAVAETAPTACFDRPGATPICLPQSTATAPTPPTPPNRLFVMPAGGGEAENIGPVAGSNPGLVWAPDSRYLAVDSDTGLYVVDLHTGSQKLIVKAANSTESFSPSFSPDSRSLVYAAPSPSEGNLSELFVTGLDGRKRQITHNFVADSPVWGPKEIAFSHYDGIWLIDGNGKHSRQLGHGLTWAESLGAPVAWSADGKSLLVTGTGVWTGGTNAWTENLKTIIFPGLAVLTFTGGPYIAPRLPLALSRDGRTALVQVGTCGGGLGPGGSSFARSEAGVEIVPRAKGVATQTVPGTYCSASWNR